MEIKRITDEQIALLNARLPDEAVSPHPTKPYLSSIKAIYVTERLNNVFGIGAWTIKTEEVSVNDKGMAVVKVTLEVPEYGFYYESFGGNDNGGAGSKNFDLGDAYKGATTDAITKIASYMGIGSDVFKGKQKGGTQQTQSNTTSDEQKPYFNDPELKLFIDNRKVENYDTAEQAIKKIKETYIINKQRQQAIKDLFADAGKPEF